MSEIEAQKWLSSRDPVIPALSYFHQQAMELLDKGYSKAAEVADIVILDPGMSLSLFQKVNAKRIISGRPFIENIHSAISFFSEQAVADFIRSHPVLPEAEPNKTSAVAFQQIIARSLFRSMLLEHWGKSQGIESTLELKSSGLLFSIGEICVCQCEFSQYQEYIQQTHNIYDCNTESEQQYFSFDFKQLGKQLVKKWALPELINESLSSDSNIGRKAQMNRLAANISWQTQFGWYHKEMTKSLEMAADFLDESPDKLTSNVHQISVQLARALPLANINHAACNLVRLPQSDHSAMKTAIKPIIIKSASKNKPDLMDIIRKLARNPGATQSQILKTLINGLNDELGLSKTVLMMLSHDKSELSVRLCNGLDNRSGFQSLTLKTQQAGLFNAFLKKTQALWVNTANYKKYNSLIPGLFKAATLSENFFIMSLFIGNKPIGIIYADCSGRTDFSLDKSSFINFKANVFFASKALNLIAEKQQLRTS